MRGRGHIFDDPEKKAEMISYWVAGYSLPQLALYYGGLHHTTILYHIKKANLKRISREQRKEIVELIKNGKDINEVAKKYSISPVFVSVYCSHEGLKGQKIISNNKKLVLQISPTWGRIKKEKVFCPKKEYNKKTPLPERPGWFLDFSGRWICAGKSFKIIKEEQKIRQEKAKVQQRLNMLTY